MKLLELTKDDRFVAIDNKEYIFVKTDGMYALITDTDGVVIITPCHQDVTKVEVDSGSCTTLQ